MRERSTWNRKDVMKAAAALKVADPYTMNQEHPQPPMDKYVTGDPSDFAEDVHTPNTWEVEYANGQTKRDEIGMPAFRSDTFNHSEKTAKEVLLKKADLCVAISQLMLSGKKVASDQLIEDQAVALMHLPDHELLATHSRLAGEQDDEDEDEGQEKQAQEQQEQDQAQSQEKQAQQEQVTDKDQDQAADKDQDKQASAKKAQDQQEQEEGKDEQSKQASASAMKIAKLIQAGNLAAAQTEIQSLVKQAQAQTQQQDQVAQQVQQMIQQAMGQGQQQQVVQPVAQQMQDDQTLDQMLATDACGGPMAETDIEMDPAPMDVGMNDLGPEDEMLRTLFAQEEEEVQEEQVQQKQAGSVRTASTRTVGTRPTGGVAKLGGSVSASKSNVDQLSSLWESAPDVRGAFGMK